MKSRRVILTIEVQTCLPLSELRDPYSITFPHRGGGGTVFADPGMEKQCIGYGTIVQVQANAIRPEPQPRSKRARMAQFAKDDAERADPRRSGWFSDRIAEVQSKPDRKAKRAKGAK